MVKSGAEAKLIPQQVRRDGVRLGTPAREISDHTNVTTGWLDEQCVRLGLNLDGVCRRAFDSGPIAVFLTEAERVQKSHGRPYTLCNINKRVVAQASDEDAIQTEVERLDELRYDDPVKAASEARHALERASGPVAVAELLGVLASAHRTLFRIDWAMVELGEAIALADAAERRDVVARLAQRAASLMMYRGKLNHANEISGEAIGIFVLLGDEERVAHCLIDLCAGLLKQGRSAEALRMGCAALALEPTSTRHRWGAYHNSAMAHLAQGDMAAAAATAERATKIAPRGRLATGSARWLQAHISWKRGRLLEAASLYPSAFEALTKPAVDRLLIGAEWTRVTLELGDAWGAARQAEELLTLHAVLERDSLDERRILSTAALELALAGRRAALSAELVDDALAKIALGRENRTARLRERLHP